MAQLRKEEADITRQNEQIETEASRTKSRLLIEQQKEIEKSRRETAKILKYDVLTEDEDDDFDAELKAELANDKKRFNELEKQRKANAKEEEKIDDQLAKDSDDRLAEDIKKTEEAEKKKSDIRKQQIQDTEKLITGVADSLDQLSDKRINKIEDEQEKNDKAVEEQQRRAEQGLSNTLAFEQQKAAELEQQKEEEQKKAEQRAKALAYLTLFTEFAKENPNSAAGKALAQVAIAETVSGLFYEGTERVEDDIAGKPLFSGRDGYVVRVDGSERIMTGSQNNRLGNISNEDLVSIATDKQSPQVVGFDTSGIVAKLDEVNRNIKSNGLKVEWDSFGNSIETRVINNITKKTMHKRGRI